MHYVYLIQHTLTYKKYVGRTNDLSRRLEEHNKGEQTSTRRKNGEWKIIYAEIFRSKADAVTREQKLKQNSRGRQELYKRIIYSELER